MKLLTGGQTDRQTGERQVKYILLDGGNIAYLFQFDHSDHSVLTMAAAAQQQMMK